MIEDRQRKKYGALPDSWLNELIISGFIVDAKPEQINPASLDLSLASEIYQVEGIFQPRPGETVRELLKIINHQPHDFSQPLRQEKVYLARLTEIINLPTRVYGYLNPKSSTGRNDVHVRVMADGTPRYDTVLAGAKNLELWIIINPKSYDIVLSPGQTLSQLRLFNLDTRFTETELEIAMAKHQLLWHRSGQAFTYQDLTITDADGSIILTLDFDSPILGYECHLDEGVVDFSQIKTYPASEFWRPITADHLVDHRLALRQNHFYLLSTAEAVRVPDTLACEMVSMDERSGEFRSHYAGFIDPGWGFGRSGQGRGRPLTLEIRPFEDLIVRPGQPIAKIRFERVIEPPLKHYDILTGSNYTTQHQVGLAKQFKN